MVDVLVWGTFFSVSRSGPVLVWPWKREHEVRSWFYHNYVDIYFLRAADIKQLKVTSCSFSLTKNKNLTKFTDDINNNSLKTIWLAKTSSSLRGSWLVVFEDVWCQSTWLEPRAADVAVHAAWIQDSLSSPACQMDCSLLQKTHRHTPHTPLLSPNTHTHVGYICSHMQCMNVPMWAC